MAHPAPREVLPAGVPHVVRYDGTSLTIDGRKTPIRAAQLHYWRLPAPNLWRDAFRKVKAAGYNTVALDFFWGYHSPRPGAYDFTGVRDVDTLLDVAAQERLYVIAQPGPYIDDGAEGGGLPDWIFARNAVAKTASSRYEGELRQWLAAIDARLAGHQLTGGRGSVILYGMQDDPAASVQAARQRAARADGINVPFISQVFAVAYDGIDWGWTGDALGAYHTHEGERLTESHPIAFPEISGWRSHRDDAERERVFDDQAWPPLLTALPRDADDAPLRAPASTSGRNSRREFLSVDDYGFHHGVVWYRGHFKASGAERAFAFAGMTGRAGAAAVWLNGVYLGSAIARDDGTISARMRIVPAALRVNAGNVISVLFENMGHNENLSRDPGGAQSRGMLRAALSKGRGSIAWHILGNGEYNTDPVRGPLNAGGLGGEIAGWHNPEFSDLSWTPATLPATTTRAGVTWYRAHVALHVSLAPERFAALRLDDAGRPDYRAFIYVNGWLVGQYRSDPGFPRVFAVPAGMLNESGDNAIAIAAWSLDGRSALGRVSFTTVDALADPHRALANIPEVHATGGVAQLSLDVAGDGKAGRPHFVYGSRDAAPTIRVRPGDTIDITLHNRLAIASDTANAVNLHFHGLDVAPAKPGDEVLMTLARPGESLRYIVHVLRSQQPGMYWYHPHVHGETYWQITSGMAGAIIVEGLRERVPSLATMRDRIIVVRDVQETPNILAIPWYARKMTPRSYTLDADDNLGPNRPCLPEVGLHLNVNGSGQPAIDIEPGEQQLFRVLNASASRVLDLAIDNERLGIVAIDGYPVGAYPQNPAVVWADHIVVPPAGRAEFIATGQSGPTLLRSRCYDSGSGGDRDPQAVLAILAPSKPPQGEIAVSRRASALSDASDTGISPGTPAVRRTVTLTEDAAGFYIDGRAFSMGAPPAIVARSGTLEEWTIRNDTDEVHDFHIHQVHFAVEALNGEQIYPRTWRDTVLVPAQRRQGTRSSLPGTARILVDFRNPAIRGTFVFHCHMLDHEDGGMMATIKVI
jgi:FtsP/CotA-like multicopper oxidase with cupredoxin domain